MKYITDEKEKEMWLKHHPYSYRFPRYIGKNVPITESQEEMLKYNTEIIDVSEIMKEIESLLEENFQLRVLFNPQFFTLETSLDGLLKRNKTMSIEELKQSFSSLKESYDFEQPEFNWHYYLQLPYIDISGYSKGELKMLIEHEIRRYPLGVAIGIGVYREENALKKQVGGYYIHPIGYKPLDNSLEWVTVFR